MTTREKTVAILFADICDSTPLYEESGDWEALGAIGRILDAHARIVEQCGGEVVRSKGDDLLSTFEAPDDALAAADRMLLEMAESSLQVRIGIHYGPTIPARGDIFGDAVNVAARLMSLARPNECIASEAFRDRLGAGPRASLQDFDQQTLKGKAEAMSLFRLVRAGEDEDATEFFLEHGRGADPARGASTHRIVLRHGDREVQCQPGDAPLSIGRADDADLHTPSRRVSRTHATVQIVGDRVVLRDLSTGGTWVLTQGTTFRLHREALTLFGKGTISLGDPPDAPNAVRVSYEIVAESSGDER